MGVRHLRVTLEAKGPIHVGNGDKLGKKDYFVSKRSGRRVVSVLDAKRFVGELSDAQLTRYSAFLESSSRGGLQDLLDKDSKMAAAAEKCIAYETTSTLTKRRNGISYQYFDVASFVKDAYGCPYVPGSSLKGVIRTALLYAVILDSPESYVKLFDRAKGRDSGTSKTMAREIERSSLWVEAPEGAGSEEKRDIMHFVSVSDSEPLAASSLAFVKKYDLFSKADDASHKHDMGRLADDSYYAGNELNIYRECLKPGTNIVFDVDIDERIDRFLPFDFALDAEGLQRVFDVAYERYKESFLDKYDYGFGDDAADSGGATDGQCRYVIQSGPFEGKRCRNRAVEGTGYCNTHAEYAQASKQDGQDPSGSFCYIGGGTDYSIKTIGNALFEDDGRLVEEASRILYGQFPSKVDETRLRGLAEEIRRAGFEPRHMDSVYDKKTDKLKKGKDDHRHWRDGELGVSPHTLKLGILEGQKLPMGRCQIRIEER